MPYVLRHLINRGQGAALQTGLDFALRRQAQYIVTFDADGQHRVEDIAALLAPISAGECEITLGSRFLGEALDMPATRRITLRLAVLFTRMVSRVPLTDAHNGLRAFSRQAGRQIRISMDRMAHASEIIDSIRQSGLPFREIPVQIRYTAYSLAKGQSLRRCCTDRRRSISSAASCGKAVGVRLVSTCPVGYCRSAISGHHLGPDQGLDGSQGRLDLGRRLADRRHRRHLARTDFARGSGWSSASAAEPTWFSYSAVVIMLIGFWMIYIRLRRVRRDIDARVVREAGYILEAEKQAESTQTANAVRLGIHRQS